MPPSTASPAKQTERRGEADAEPGPHHGHGHLEAAALRDDPVAGQGGLVPQLDPVLVLGAVDEMDGVVQRARWLGIELVLGPSMPSSASASGTTST